MSNIIPKHSYFKLTTRSTLTEAEKTEMIAAAEDAMQYLLRMSKTFDLVEEAIPDGFGNMRYKLHYVSYRMKYLSRCLHYVKGSTQPRYLYRRSRREAIESEAWRISKETGAPYEQVRAAFLDLMHRFISEG